MNDETDLFDLDFDDESSKNDEKVDNKPSNSNTMSTKSAKKSANSKRSGKKSGASTGAPSKQKRVPMHVRQPIQSAPRDGYVRRLVNDKPGRVDRFKLAGWTPVEDGTQVGDPLSTQATNVGAASAKQVGDGRWGVLMEIPEEIYKQDQADKHQKIDEDEESQLSAKAEEVGGGTGEHRGHISIGSGQN